MEEIVTGTYLEYKKTLDTELAKTAESFVRIGYLLKVARDTEVLKESGYSTVAEFAKAEYGLSKDVVSRFIHINDRFSENGYGETLDSKYKGFGYSKLAEMLTLPDNIADALVPEMTRQQIQEVKQEVKEEQKVTDLEVLMEEKRQEQIELKTDLERFIHQYGHDNKKNFKALFKALADAEADKENCIEKILDVLAPTGVNTVFVRISGRGKLMLSIKGKDEKPELLDMRANTTVSYTWVEVANAIGYVYKDGTKEAWESLYGEPFEKEEKKAEESKEKEPEQQSIKQPEQETKKAEAQEVQEDNSGNSVTKEQESGIQLSLKLPPEECKDMLFSKWFEFVAEEKIETACERLVHMRFTEFINTSPQKLGLLVQTSELTTEETKLDGETVVSVNNGTNHVYFTLPDFQARFRKAFLEPYKKRMSAAEEKKPEVAPVQPDSTEEDEQIPGQKTVEDYPEMKPEKKLLESDYVTIAVRCMPGDIVYFLLDQEVMEATVTKLTIGPNKIPMIEAKAGDPNIFMEFNQAEDWDVTIFKSQEAAEKVLVKEE